MTKRPNPGGSVLLLGLLLGAGCASALTTAPSPPQSPPPAVAPAEAEVDRAEVGNGDEAAQFSPEVRDGRPHGIRIYDVRPEGVFARIGLQNGDVLTALNGVEITSPDQALEVYGGMTSVNRFTVALERDGKKLERSFRVR